MGFHPDYARLVLQPSYAHWREHFAVDLLRVHRAHLVMLDAQGLLPAGVAARLRRGLDELGARWVSPAELPDGPEDLYFLQEQELTRQLGADAGYLHLARSRNDMDTTVFRLVWKRRLLVTARAAESLARALRRQSTRQDLWLLSTHGQPANVSTLGHYLSAFLLEVLDDLEELLDALAVVDRSTLGACAITTTGFDVDRDLVASLLGLERPVTNSYQAIASGHWLLRPSAALGHLAVDLTRLVADLGPRASGENGSLGFPDELVQSSSIMPQKRNPVILEHVRIQAGLALSTYDGSGSLFRNLAFQDVNEVADEPITALLAASGHLDAALGLTEVVVDALEVHQDVVLAQAAQLGVTSTELADALVGERGLNFRDAHGAVKAFVLAGRSPEALRRALEAQGRDVAGVTDDWIEQALEPRRFVAVRTVPGGPAPEGMQSVLAEAGARLGQSSRRLDAWDARELEARDSLERRWSALG